MSRTLVLLALICVGGVLHGAAFAADLAPRFSIWDVQLGMSVGHLPEADVVDIACGTNGGPPSRPLEFFEDFRACRPESSGLHEVQFSYDDELEFIAKALELEVEAALYEGTSVYAHPVIVSVLVDEDGVVQGYRIVTDPRADLYSRRRAVALRRNLFSRFGDGWTCRDFEAAEGETPVANQFIKVNCTLETADKDRVVVDASYLRKKGQTAINRQTGAANRSYFESSTRLELVRRPYQPTALAR